MKRLKCLAVIGSTASILAAGISVTAQPLTVVHGTNGAGRMTVEFEKQDSPTAHSSRSSATLSSMTSESSDTPALPDIPGLVAAQTMEYGGGGPSNITYKWEYIWNGDTNSSTRAYGLSRTAGFATGEWGDGVSGGAYLYTHAAHQFTNLGAVNSGMYIGYAVNDSSTVVGAAAFVCSNSSSVTFFDPYGMSGESMGISGDGTVVAGMANVPGGANAYAYLGSTLHTLCPYNSDLEGYIGVSQLNGLVCGTFSTYAGGYDDYIYDRGFVWDHGTFTQTIGLGDGTNTVWAYALNDAGHTVGRHDNWDTRVFDTGFICYGNTNPVVLPDGVSESYGVNNLDQVVGYGAYLYTGGSIKYISTLMDPPLPAGRSPFEGRGVNDVGQIILNTTDGMHELAILLTPDLSTNTINLSATLTNGWNVMTLTAPAGYYYWVQATTNLLDPSSWQTIGQVNNQSGTKLFYDADQFSFLDKRFYRIMRPS